MTEEFNMQALVEDLTRDEGVRLHPYKCTAGKLTIGIGRNIEDVGISTDEAEFLLKNDIDRCESELDQFIPWWRDLSEGRQRAVLNMVFNMGISRFSGFKRMLAALKDGRYDRAATEALESRWADQVGDRALRIAHLLRED